MRIACGLFALLLGGCGMPPVIDPAGLQVQRPLLVAAVAGGWVVVDSVRGRARAVAELTSVLSLDGAARHERVRPILRCAAGLAVTLLRVRSEPPRCGHPPGASCGAGQQCRNGIPYATQCAQVVRAEFALERVPHDGDSLTFLAGDDTSRARWGRR